MSSSVHVDNKGKDILIIEKFPTQGLGEHSLTAENMYSITFTEHSKKFCLIIMEQIVICLLMVKKFINSKQNILTL